jgi:hypothetical protein
MPLQHTLESFIALVEDGQTVEAMIRYYAEAATMQENQAAPRVGKRALIEHEQAALSSIARLKAQCIRPVLMNGDVVVIRWVFEIEDKVGRARHFEEIAYQRWEQDRIVEEKFFYDPSQFK